jgi:hypothetical protein
MRYIVVSAYYLLMTGWIYWVDAGHGDSWWTVAPMAVAQVGLGLVLGRWWVPVLPTALPLIAIPAGYPESQYSEPLPLWFGMAYAAALRFPSCCSVWCRGRSTVRGASSVEEVVDLGVLRESTFPLFREDELAVGEHVVLALLSFLDLGLVLGLGVQLGRETRGPRVVAVSDGAVLDQDARHGEKPTD